MLIKDIAKFGAALAWAFLIGCSDPGNTDKMAEQVADNYYQALKNKDFEKASQFFMETQIEPRAQWLDEIRQNNSKLGDLKSYKLVDKVVNTVYSGTRYTLKYKTEYAKFPAYETLILFDGVSTFGAANGSGNKLQIEAMTIRSKGL